MKQTTWNLDWKGEYVRVAADGASASAGDDGSSIRLPTSKLLDGPGFKELLTACSCPSADISHIRHLLTESGVSPNSVSDAITFVNDGHSPLLDASGNGNTEVVQLLLRHGANVNQVTITGIGIQPKDTPLFAAIAEGHAEVACILMAHGADLFIKILNIPILHAAPPPSEVYPFILNHARARGLEFRLFHETDDLGQTVFHHTAESSHVDEGQGLRILLKHYARVTADRVKAIQTTTGISKDAAELTISYLPNFMNQTDNTGDTALDTLVNTLGRLGSRLGFTRGVMGFEWKCSKAKHWLDSIKLLLAHGTDPSKGVIRRVARHIGYWTAERDKERHFARFAGGFMWPIDNALRTLAEAQRCLIVATKD